MIFLDHFFLTNRSDLVYPIIVVVYIKHSIRENRHSGVHVNKAANCFLLIVIQSHNIAPSIEY